MQKGGIKPINSFLTKKNKSLSTHQSGNKKSHSTETLNIFITDQILQAMDQKKVTALILIDLSKDFDSLSHKVLLRKLADIGLPESATKWFCSYLTGRSQYVKIGSSKSMPLHITHGVPQRSILSPSSSAFIQMTFQPQW